MLYWLKLHDKHFEYTKFDFLNSNLNRISVTHGHFPVRNVFMQSIDN